MKNFIMEWLRDALWFCLCSFIVIAFTVIFGVASVTWWPEYAWGSTVVFSLITICIVIFIIWKRR